MFTGACAENSAEGNSEWKNSVKEAARNLVAVIKTAPTPPPPPDVATEDILLQWMQPVSGVKVGQDEERKKHRPC